MTRARGAPAPRPALCALESSGEPACGRPSPYLPCRHAALCSVAPCQRKPSLASRSASAPSFFPSLLFSMPQPPPRILRSSPLPVLPCACASRLLCAHGVPITPPSLRGSLRHPVCAQLEAGAGRRQGGHDVLYSAVHLGTERTEREDLASEQAHLLCWRFEERICAELVWHPSKGASTGARPAERGATGTGQGMPGAGSHHSIAHGFHWKRGFQASARR